MRGIKGSRLDEALDMAEAEYYDLSMLPWTWALFFLVCIICGTGLHTWLLRLLPGIMEGCNRTLPRNNTQMKLLLEMGSANRGTAVAPYRR